MSDLSPADLHWRADYIAADARTREAVFGRERLAAAIGHTATTATAAEFMNIVHTVCSEEAELSLDLREQVRSLWRPDGELPIMLSANRYASVVFQNQPTDASLAAATFSQGRKFMKPKGMLPGRYDIEETVFIGQDRRARVLRNLSRRSIFGHMVSLSAVKRATEGEVENAISAIVEAVHHDTAYQAFAKRTIKFEDEQ